MQKVMVWGLILLYVFGTLILFATAGGLFFVSMLGDNVYIFALLAAIVIYFYSLKKMREVLQKNEKLKAYLIGNGVVWALAFILSIQCAGTTFNTH